MYEVYVGTGNGHYDLLYEDTSMAPKLGLIDPILSLEESKSGQFTTTLPISHPLYSTIERRVTEFRVYRSGNLFWKGCLLSDDLDFFKQRKMVVEGPLGFLNDTMQHDMEFEIESDHDIWEYLNTVLNTHNAKVKTSRKVYLGNVSVKKNQTVRKLVSKMQPDKLTLSRDTSSKSAIDQLLSQYGGYFEVTYTYTHPSEGSNWDGYPIPVLNYRQDFIEIDPDTGHEKETTDRPISSQTIIFAKNLMDLTKTVSMSDIATVIVPLGANDEDGNPITIASVNDGKDYIYVSDDLFNKYGWIEKTVTWPDIDNKTTLKQLARYYATNLQFFEGGVLDVGTLTLNITAIDMKYYNADADAINLSEKVRVYSEYHNTDQYYPCQKMEIHMANPENTVISLGRTVSDNSMTTKVSNMEKDTDSDETDWSDEINSLDDRISSIEDWAELNGFDPNIDPSGYMDGQVDGWVYFVAIMKIYNGVDILGWRDKYDMTDPPAWMCTDDLDQSIFGCGYHIFDKEVQNFDITLPLYNPAVRLEYAGYWFVGSRGMYYYQGEPVNGWTAGELIHIIE